MSNPSILRRLGSVGATVFERGWLSSNNILIRGEVGDPVVLVDTGHVSHAEQTLDLVATVLRGARLDAVLNTHLHSDHCGANASLARRFECDVMVPVASFDAARQWDDAALSFRETGQSCERFNPTHSVSPGSRLRLGSMSWEAIPACGHDDQALMYFQADHGVLISGDALWESRVAVLFPMLQGRDGIAGALKTLDVIESLDPRVVVPGHGAAFDTSARALRTARARLLAFAEDPDKHTRYALKALLVFHLMEQGVVTEPRERLSDWVLGSSIFERVLPGSAEASRQLCDRCIDELIATGSLIQGSTSGSIELPRN
ncbi:MAG: MBL fold metallo-hydrolase [Rubrivivax sp.]|nr:MBL fold metallo-hydrolase [Rubrivivax sp.]